MLQLSSKPATSTAVYTFVTLSQQATQHAFAKEGRFVALIRVEPDSKGDEWVGRSISFGS